MPPSESVGSARAEVGDLGQHRVGLLEQLERRLQARQAGEVHRDAGQAEAGQGGELAGQRCSVLGQHALSPIAQVDCQQDRHASVAGSLRERPRGRGI